MKLLVITQKVDKNDAILGFFHGWLKEFAKHCERITVICLEKGVYDLPANIEILSLGKEYKRSKLQYLVNFYRYIWRERVRYDSVFVHMNPVYVVLGGVLWKMWSKRVTLWYTHKKVDLKLRMAEKLCHIIFSASRESFRLKSKKLRIVGHGIEIGNLEKIMPTSSDIYTILSVARISLTKNQLLMVETLDILKRGGFKGKLVIVGAPVTVVDMAYQKRIIEMVKSKKLESEVIFKGSFVPNLVIDEYRSSDLFINLSTTGSLDKAVLEAMASGLQVITSNEAFKEIIPEKNQCALVPAEIADKILILSKEKVDPVLRHYVVEKHNIKNLIPRICDIIHNNENATP